MGLHGERGGPVPLEFASQVKTIRQFLLLALSYFSLLLKDTSCDQGRQALQWTSGMFVICHFPI